MKTGVQIDDGSENRHGHTCDHDRPHIGAQPDDQQRRESGFWETVQDDKVRLQNPRKFRTGPQKNCRTGSQDHHKKETQQGFSQCDADMREKFLAAAHFCEIPYDGSGTAENKGIDPAFSGGDFP